MNFPYKVADQQHVVMARSVYLDCIFLKNCGEERKTNKRVSVTVSVTCSKKIARSQVSDEG